LGKLIEGKSDPPNPPKNTGSILKSNWKTPKKIKRRSAEIEITKI